MDAAQGELGEPHPGDGVVFDAIVLAGGAGRRLPGAVKPEVRVGGVALVDRALAAVAGARHVVLVAPPALTRAGVPRTLEDPPLGGPVAGLAAGLTALPPAPPTTPLDHPREGFSDPVVARHAAPGTASRATTGSLNAAGDDEIVVVLACDVPRAGSVVEALVLAAGVRGADGARLVDRDGRAQHLVAAYRRSALVAALGRLGDVRGASVRALVGDLALVDVPDPGGAADDADTWDDVRRLDAELSRTDLTRSSRGTIRAVPADPLAAERADPPDGSPRDDLPPDEPLTDRRTP